MVEVLKDVFVGRRMDSAIRKEVGQHRIAGKGLKGVFLRTSARGACDYRMGRVFRTEGTD